MLKQLTLLFLLVILTSPNSFADTWDEIANGGGDAGNFPVGGFQTTVSSTIFDSITGSLSNVDQDAYFVTFNEATWSIVADTSGTEDDTHLYLFDVTGNLLMANDDIDTFNSTFHSQLADTASFPNPLIDNPLNPVVGSSAIVVIGGLEDNAIDAAGNLLATFNDNPDALFGQNPDAGSFANWQNSAIGGGTYQLNLTGVTFGEFVAVPEPSSLMVLVFGVGALTLRRTR
jgi:hypothetical protein